MSNTIIGKNGLDARYTIAMEFTGHAVQQHVLRFCGDYIGGYQSLALAKEAGFLDFLLRDLANCGYEVLTECEGVTLFKGLVGNPLKVVYGAQVTDFCTIEEAMDGLKWCVLHSLECGSKLN